MSRCIAGVLFTLAFGTAALHAAPPRTEDLTIERTAKGSIAIVRDDLPANPAAADPGRLAQPMRQAGYGVTFLRLGDLIDPQVLNGANFDVLVLPSAPYYPVAGRDTLIAYLESGGHLFCTGGYAFDRPLAWSDGAWQPVETGPVAPDEPEQRAEARINTRFGKPGDILWLKPDQIGVFDPAYPLRDVAFARPAPGQSILEGGFRLGGELNGHAAVALTGSNHPVFPDAYARWIPLINSYDQYGRLRGAAGAVVHHHAGPFAGSRWAIFGVTNRDLFADEPLAEAGIVDIIDALVSRPLLRGLTTNWASYDGGEPIDIAADIDNARDASKGLQLEIQVDDKFVDHQALALERGESRRFEHRLSSEGLAEGLHRVTLRLRRRDKLLDTLETGFVIRGKHAMANGPRIMFEDNYFRINDRPTFLTGTNTTGMMWYSPRENPLVWDRDFTQMRDHGLTLLRILHFSPFASVGYEGKTGSDPTLLKTPPPEKLIRQTDAIVQLAQSRGIVIFLTLHDWMLVELTDEELAAQREWNRYWTERYRDVPGVIFDVQNEPWQRYRNRPHMRRRFNAWLQDKYGSDEKLRAAWGGESPKSRLGEIDLPENYDNDRYPWSSTKAADLVAFRVHVLHRWTEANAAGVFAGDPEAILTVGYLPNMWPADKILGTRHTTFSNMHWYGPITELPTELKQIDRRFDGKSLSLGEFGAQESHDARTHGREPPDDAVSITRYLNTVHYCFGLGGSAALDWCWKDFDDCIFPWGTNHAHDLVPKNHLRAFRDMSLLLATFEPKYASPETFVLVPDHHRLGSRFGDVHKAIRNSMRLLMENHVNFGVINEYDLDRLPESARVLVYPVPYCPKDETFEKVLAFVREGGSLYFSGDIAYDTQRQRTRITRFDALNLEDPGGHEPLALGEHRVIAQTARVGEGSVFFMSGPIEMRPTPAARELYRDVLDAFGVPPIPIEPADPAVHAFTIPTTDGGMVYVFCNTRADQPVKISLPSRAGSIEMTLAASRPGLVWLDGQGRLRAIEAAGPVSVNGESLLHADGHVAVASLDEADIAASRELLILPFDPGRYEIVNTHSENRQIVQFGELRGGVWHRLERKPATRADGVLTIDVRPDQAPGIFTCCEEDRTDSVASRIAALATHRR